jgi:hypothetical protein
MTRNQILKEILREKNTGRIDKKLPAIFLMAVAALFLLYVMLRA